MEFGWSAFEAKRVLSRGGAVLAEAEKGGVQMSILRSQGEEPDRN
jgi:hypothetical protein